MEIKYRDGYLLREIIRRFNDHIDMYGCITILDLKQWIGVPDSEAKYSDSLYGWKDHISEQSNVKAILENREWILVLTLAEPKEL